ncbi:MAG: molybdenum cofactor guanylyltransferase [Candidatus Marinimicrobia bacterium]|nr:molybdenum cofactor guanylyltransferase [Candidatus Neomarinimicrobiota bacterium]MCF7923034.1 molybdenum cofactor guanylyltransferase [Candidatus Neomarinimicrobiota bacterium]
MNTSLCNSCTAIILAGGSAQRMGKDKRFLKVGNERLLDRQVGILKQYFEDVIISANDPEALAYLNVPVVKDEYEGRGPLEGLTSVLKTSRTEYNFVVAVDIPGIDMTLVEKMRSHLDHVSAVIPVCIDGHQEPLFAFYSKNCIPIFRAAMDEGEFAIHRALKRCPVYFFPMKGETPLKNLNRTEEYEAYIKGQH